MLLHERGGGIFRFCLQQRRNPSLTEENRGYCRIEGSSKQEDIQSWLGTVNYYRKFIPDMSTIIHPLTALLADKVDWCAKVNELLVSSEVLIHYDPNNPVGLAVDASSYGLGAVISHTTGDEDRPIAYVSRTLTSAERNYSQIEKEALAIIFGVRKFHQYLRC